MIKKIKGLIFLIVLVGILLVALILLTSNSDGLQNLQSTVNRITGDRFRVDLTGFGEWSSSVKNEAMEKLPKGQSLFRVEDEALPFVEGYSIYEEDINLEFNSKTIQKVYMMIGACELKQVESAEKKIQVASSQVGKLQCFQLDDTLFIIAGQKVKEGVNIGTKKGTITLSMPKDKKLQNLKVELGAGNIVFDQMKVEEASFDVGAGDIYLGSLISTNGEFKIGMGRMEVADASVSKASVDVGVGEFLYTGAFKKSAKISCSMGRVKLTLHGTKKDYNYALECSVGTIAVGETTYSNVSTTKKMDNGSKKSIDLECSVGSIEIEFEEEVTT